MFHVLLNLFCKMFQELIHLFAFSLHGFISDVRCAVICFFEFIISQAADFLRFFLCNVSGVGKNRGKYSAQVFTFSLAILRLSF